MGLAQRGPCRTWRASAGDATVITTKTPERQTLRRSMLFIPANVRRYAEKALTTNADGVVLDLEDSVPSAERETARGQLAEMAQIVAPFRLVLTRVNSRDALEADLLACREAEVAEILLPKVDNRDQVCRFLDVCDALSYTPKLSILVESGYGLSRLPEILTSAPIETVALGVEDLRAELELSAPNSTHTSPTLMHAHSTLILAALAAGVTPIGLLGSIAQFADRELLTSHAEAAWTMGYRGSYAIHPDQVAVMNEAYRPSSADTDWAHRVIQAAEAARADGRGSFSVDSSMIDSPLIERAHAVLRYSELALSTYT